MCIRDSFKAVDKPFREGCHKSGNTALQCVGGQERGKGKHGGIQDPAGIHYFGNAFFVIVDYIFDLADDELASMHVFAKKVALAIQKSFPRCV